MRRKAKILMLIDAIGYGGAQSAFLRLAEYLAGEMNVTIVLMVRGDGKYFDIVRSRINIPIIILNREDESRLSPIFKVARWQRMARILRQLKREHDATISFLSGPNLLNAIASGKGATILSERGSKHYDSGMTRCQKWVWTRLLDPLAYRLASCIVAASDGLAGEIIQANPSIATRVRSIEGTVLTKQLLKCSEAPVEPEFEELLKYKTIICFGRMHHQKGYDALVTIFARLRSVRQDARLLFIGDGPMLESLLAQSCALGLRTGDRITPQTTDVIFAGYRDDPLRYLRYGRVFALTSRYEGLPNALIEALAAGVPILAADCPWGPRTILAGSDDAKIIGNPELPMKLSHGILMPMIDSAEGSAIWEKVLLQHLDSATERRSYADRHAAVFRFDIQTSGVIWKKMIYEFLSDFPAATLP